MRVREFETGQVIFSENERGESAFVIEQGRVEVLKTIDGVSVHLAFIEAGEPFGEMSLIDEKPRSATIVAVTRTLVREFHRDDFLHSLQMHSETSINLLKLLFERLREANAVILEMYRSGHETPISTAPLSVTRQPAVSPQTGISVALEGITPQARQALAVPVLRIPKFPFRIGRHTGDALAHNDLSIVDRAPFHISRHHVSIARSANRVSLSDRGSHHGFLVDGKRIGGDGSPASTIFLDRPDAILVLGGADSPFKFKVMVSQV